MLKIRGIDISNWQGQPDYSLVKQNCEFVVIKTSEGNGFTDPQFKRNQTEIRKAGLLLGYYHFARPDLGNSAIAEADWFLKVIGEIKDGEMLVLDYEVNFSNPVGWCKDFLSHIYNKTGCRSLIYLNQSQILGLNWQSVVNENFGLWVASYDGNPEGLSFNTPWATVAMKQYTSSGSIPGIAGAIDMNSFFGDIATFKAYGYHTPTPEPIPTQPVIDDKFKYDFQGDIGVQELGAIKSIINDLRRDLKACQSISCKPLEALFTQVKAILYSKGFWWTKLNNIKKLIPQ